MKRLFLLAGVSALACSAPAFAESVGSVTLYETGLAEIGMAIPGDRPFTFQVELKDVDDILKSLVLRGEGLEGARITAEATDHQPTPLELSSGPEAILESLIGQIVTFPSRQQTGAVLRVADSTECGEHGCGKIVTILRTEDMALVTIPLTDSLEIIPADEEASKALADTAVRIGKARLGHDMRALTITTDGAGGEVAASYVIAAPVWSTSWRAETAADGKASIEAWAVIRNATREDWSDVRLTLSSGAPRAIQADLYATRWGEREKDQVNPPITLARSALQAFSATTDHVMAAEAAPAAPMGALVAGNDAQEGLDARFTFDDPVDLAAGQILSLPLVTGDFDARSRSVWVGGNGHDMTGNPDRSLELTNTLPVRVPAGIMTIRDGGIGFAGDTRVPMMAPGESRDLSYGKDLMIEVDESVRESVSAIALDVTPAGVVVEDRRVVETRYDITLKGAEDRELWVRHPVRDGWAYALDIPGDDKEQETKHSAGGDDLEISMKLVPGSERRFTIRAESPVKRLFGLEDLHPGTLMTWLERENLDPEAADWLRAALDIRQRQDALSSERARLADSRSMISSNQQRIAGLLAVIDRSSSEYGRFSADLAASEDKIRNIDARLGEIEERIVALDGELAGLRL